MVSAAAVSTALQQMLQSADMDTTTERMIREQLEKQLGSSMTPHKKLISEKIQEFLEGAGDDDEEEDEEAQDNDEENAKPVLTTKPKPERKPVANSSGDLVIELDSKKRLTVGAYKGVKRVDIREFYEKDGELLPGQKGLSLNLEQWGVLSGQLQQIQQALSSGTDLVLDLAFDRKASVTEFKRVRYLDLREYYEKDGEQKPGKKGVMLNSSAVDTIVRHMTAISKSTGPIPTAAPPAKKQKVEAASTSEPKDYIELSKDKRVSISNFKGKTLVDLREWYQDRSDGSMKPGKKGISLSADDWQTVCSSVDAVNQAIASSDTSFKVALSGKRQLSLSTFKGKTYVGIREFYEKDGELLPGSKGLNMGADLWPTLVAGMEIINKQLR